MIEYLLDRHNCSAEKCQDATVSGLRRQVGAGEYALHVDRPTLEETWFLVPIDRI